MIIDKAFLDSLTAQAKASARLRMNYDLRNSSEDGSQRMLNALEPGTEVPVHRHLTTSETVVIVRGRIREDFYDEEGRLTESVELVAGGDVPALQVPAGVYHSVVSLESGSVICEVKDGKYSPEATEVFVE